MNKLIFQLASGCLGLAVLAMDAGAGVRQASNPGFPAERVVEDTVLRFLGSGVLRFKGLIPIYDAALYVGAGVQPDEALKDVAKRLEVRYRVSADAERFCTAGERILARSIPAHQLAAVRARLDLINSWYPDSRPGDRCSITYIPGRGTELVYNGRTLGLIEGTDFAAVYFSIWLGSDPASHSLKKALVKATSP